jgi:riboflavin synthase
MFTGLIEAQGRVERATPRAGSVRLTIRPDFSAASIALGESIAVDGACLTVARRAGGAFEADVVRETLARTTLGTLRRGDVVHLERSLSVGDRLGGHLVLGHVDAVAKVVALRRRGGDVRLEVALPQTLRGLIALKGSVALQGVSLTVAAVGRRSFEVALIPETIARTRLGRLTAGDGVNVEVDLLARYLDAWIRERAPLRAPRGRSR